MNYLEHSVKIQQNASEFQTDWCHQGYTDFVVTCALESLGQEVKFLVSV